MYEWTTYSTAGQRLGGDGGKQSRGDQDDLHFEWFGSCWGFAVLGSVEALKVDRWWW